ncbi:MAG: cupin domain-containing protein [Proteobacteria bacterium]|nr:cupin domain-containing protein [Pseudomonadota bacterium]MCP4916063.1 cupin domain-containing protein [Pseudomonadota bacterium]
MRRVEKPWGHEEIWAETSEYLGKILVIRAGRRLSLQHHVHKEETIRVLSGVLRLDLEDDDGVLQTRDLEPGASAHILPGRRHRFGAVQDCELVEVSTAFPNDVVRHVDDYGRQGTVDP